MWCQSVGFIGIDCIQCASVCGVHVCVCVCVSEYECAHTHTPHTPPRTLVCQSHMYSDRLLLWLCAFKILVWCVYVREYVRACCIVCEGGGVW